MFQTRPRLPQIALFLCIGLFTLLALNPTAIGLANDKLDHFAAFLVLGVLVRLTYPALGALLTGLGLAAFGGVLELLQASHFIHHDCDIRDWGADLAGIALAILIARVFVRSARRPEAS